MNHNYNDDAMNKSPPKDAETTWVHENELQDSNDSNLKSNKEKFTNFM